MFGFSALFLHAPALVEAAQGKKSSKVHSILNYGIEIYGWVSCVDHTLSSRTPPSTSYITARLPAHVNDLFQGIASCNTGACAHANLFPLLKNAGVCSRLRRKLWLTARKVNSTWFGCLFYPSSFLISCWNPDIKTQTEVIIQAASWGLYVCSGGVFWISGAYLPLIGVV